jgi:hypothetical protein
MNKKNILLLSLLSSLALASCMHVGMMGHQSSDVIPAESAVEKELSTDGVRAIAWFPPLEYGEDVTITLRLFDENTHQPISGAKVYFHANYLHTVDSTEKGSGAATHGNHGNISKETGHDVHIEREVEEGPEPGTYTMLYGSYQPGPHRVMFHIVAIPGRTLESELVIETTRTVQAAAQSLNTDPMHHGNTGTLVLVGAGIMGAVMVAMMLTHSGMW